MMTASPHAALIAALHAIPAQPIDSDNPLAALRPLFAGTLTFEQALTPEIQAALDACETFAYHHSTPGRSLCERLNDVRPIPAPLRVIGW